MDDFAALFRLKEVRKLLGGKLLAEPFVLHLLNDGVLFQEREILHAVGVQRAEHNPGRILLRLLNPVVKFLFHNGLHLFLHVLGDMGDVVGGEVNDILHRLRRQSEEGRYPRRHLAEIPEVRDRNGEVNVSHALPADERTGDLNAAVGAYNSLILNSLVLSAAALKVVLRSEYLLAEQPVALGPLGTVVYRLRFRHLAERPRQHGVGRAEPDTE